MNKVFIPILFWVLLGIHLCELVNVCVLVCVWVCVFVRVWVCVCGESECKCVWVFLRACGYDLHIRESRFISRSKITRFV